MVETLDGKLTVVDCWADRFSCFIKMYLDSDMGKYLLYLQGLKTVKYLKLVDYKNYANKPLFFLNSEEWVANCTTALIQKYQIVDLTYLND